MLAAGRACWLMATQVPPTFFGIRPSSLKTIPLALPALIEEANYLFLLLRVNMAF
jgi:hypothetical protein